MIKDLQRSRFLDINIEINEHFEEMMARDDNDDIYLIFKFNNF